MDPEHQVYRQILVDLAPAWLKRGIGGNLLYAFGLLIDTLTDVVTLGVKTAYPNVVTAESLPLQGRDRKIPRAPDETNGAYATALIDWRAAHRTRGGGYSLLEALRRFYLSAPFTIALIYRSGRRLVLDTSGTITRTFATWSEGDPAEWARWWVVLHWPTTVDDDGLWSDSGIWDDGGVWDSNLTGVEVGHIKAIPSNWGNAHTKGKIVLLHSGELWGEPVGTWGDPGTWGGESIEIVA